MILSFTITLCNLSNLSAILWSSADSPFGIPVGCSFSNLCWRARGGDGGGTCRGALPTGAVIKFWHFWQTLSCFPVLGRTTCNDNFVRHSILLRWISEMFCEPYILGKRHSVRSHRLGRRTPCGTRRTPGSNWRMASCSWITAGLYQR